MPTETDPTVNPTPAPPKARAARWPYLLVILAVALAAWSVLRPQSADRSQAVDPAEVLKPGSAKGFNLLFVTLDTTRVDHLGCYGYAQAQTPTIDSLAARGVRFDDAVTSVPLTLPSHAVMMTGKYPPELGVRVNGDKLTEDHITLAEILSSNGYDTAAFVGAFVLDQRWGLAQGFDTYDFQVTATGRKGLGSIVNERQADAVTASALRWLKERAAAPTTSPFFMWLHYFDPHHPFESPLAELPAFEGRPYDAEISMADMQINRVFDWLRQHGLFDNTLVVFATDHGEGFFDKDEAQHGVFLYESTLRTAIIVSNPRLFAGAYRVDDRVVGTVDLLPTILELLDFPTPAGLVGRSLRAPRDAQRSVYIETEFPLNFACAALYGLRRHGDKYISAPQPEYYDLTRDPREMDNLYAADSPTIAALHHDLLTLLGQVTTDRPVAELPAADASALASLGYVGGTRANREDLPDPKEHIHIINRMTEVLRLKAQGELDQALTLVKEIVEQSEGWNIPIMTYADLLDQSGRRREAAELLRTQAQADPANGLYFEYAKKLFLLDEREQCLAVLNQHVFTRDRELGKAHMLAGDCLMALQRHREALAAFEQARTLDGDQLGDELIRRIETARELIP